MCVHIIENYEKIIPTSPKFFYIRYKFYDPASWIQSTTIMFTSLLQETC